MARYQLKTRPVIGVTTSDGGQWLSWSCIALNLWLSGAKPVRIRPMRPRLDEHVDGLVLGGGRNISPRLYDQQPLPGYVYDAARDALEIAWMKRAEREMLPVLGICRGAQLMNVVHGGSLYQDIRKMTEKAAYPNGTIGRIFYRKGMQVKDDSLLYRILGVTDARVNSLHTQGIGQLGLHLRITACDEHHIVQAIEGVERCFWLGVQFHPEYLAYQGRFRRIFDALVQDAGLYRIEQEQDDQRDQLAMGF